MADIETREQVRARYAEAAAAVAGSTGRTALEVVDAEQCCAPSSDAGEAIASCCSGSVEVGAAFGAGLYSGDERAELPVEAVAASLGCGNPMMVAELREGEKVLVPGGRIGISDVVAEDHLTPAERAERGSFVGCIAGALSRKEYVDGLAAAGFVDAEVTFTHEASPGMHGAIIRARKPLA